MNQISIGLRIDIKKPQTLYVDFKILGHYYSVPLDLALNEKSEKILKTFGYLVPVLSMILSAQAEESEK